MEKTRILVVEDEVIIAKDLQWRLKDMGYDMPSIAGNGEDAVSKAREFNPDLILMDIMLPGQMDGIEAAKQIRSRADIPVVYLTAYSDDSIVERAKITEPFGYIIKPAGNRELKRTIEMTLHKHRSEKVLRENRDWLYKVLSSIGDAVITADAGGLVIFMNHIAEALTGWSLKEASGQRLEKIINLVNEETGEKVEIPVNRVLRERKTFRPSEKMLLISNDGTRIPVEDSIASIMDEKGVTSGIVLVLFDITERKAAEDALNKSHQSLLNVLDGIDAIVYVADMRTYEILYVNEYTKNIFGDLKGKICWKTLQSGQSSPCAFCTNDKLLTPLGAPDKPYRWEFKNTVNNRWYDVHDRAIEWPDGRVVRLEIATDITERKKDETTLRSMSLMDDLTGLHNRRGFLTLANQQIKNASRDKKGLVMIFADLDNMKWINDTSGHIVGDRALKEVAGILKLTFRDSDIIARIGGDEFVILASERPGTNAKILTDRIQYILDIFNKRENKPFTLSLSLGIVSYDPGDPCSIEELLSRADKLMYEQKKIRDK